MGEENDGKLFNNEVRIKGTVISFEKKVGKSGKEWGVLILNHIRKFKEEKIPEHYEISVFSKALEGPAAQIKEDDFIEAVCRVQSEEWKERWYVKLSLKDFRFLQYADCAEGIATESGTREVPAPKAVEDDAPLPF